MTNTNLKMKTLFSTMLAACLVFSTVVLAEEEDNPLSPSYKKPQDALYFTKNNMDVVDTNGDGVVAKEEYMALHVKEWAQLDPRGKGYVNRERALGLLTVANPLDPRHKELGEVVFWNKELIEKVDANQDKKLQKEEFMQYWGSQWTAKDTAGKGSMPNAQVMEMMNRNPLYPGHKFN